MNFFGLWKKKHGILVNIMKNFILFSYKYCSHSGAHLVLILTMLTTENSIIFITIQQNSLFNQIPKKNLAEEINYFLKIQ